MSRKEQIKLAVAKVRKALVAAVAVAVIKVLNHFGISIDNDTIQLLVDAGLIAGLVWAMPNAKPYVDEENIDG